ncbi:ribonuclease T2 isoform X1 [Bubalus kerabau]|uniref:ribonuclease T2 isoform X1 n=1 Tax=Bubalus carabanensis TaxID=3119969 RepID=UPI000DBC83E5|nr:ribonuclease T2 isoform X1 [Bubalus carabanensis]
MNSPAFLGALCLALSCLGGAHGLWRSDDLEWSKLIMVHHWPATVCQTSHTEERLPRQKGSKQEGLREVASHCKDPPNYWTIHGLWPDKSEACNRSWPFNPKEIQDLLPDMKMYWPDLLHPSNCSLRFWSHEWKKHGTCAAQLDALNSQRKYFGKSLDLYKALALTSMLQKLGIEPSTDHYYQVSDIRDALVTVYKVVPKVQCFLLEKGQEVQLLGQVELCFSKDLQLQNCSHAAEPAARRQEAWPNLGLHVCNDGLVLYPPLNETKL